MLGHSFIKNIWEVENANKETKYWNGELAPMSLVETIWERERRLA